MRSEDGNVGGSEKQDLKPGMSELQMFQQLKGSWKSKISLYACQKKREVHTDPCGFFYFQLR